MIKTNVKVRGSTNGNNNNNNNNRLRLFSGNFRYYFTLYCISMKKIRWFMMLHSEKQVGVHLWVSCLPIVYPLLSRLHGVEKVCGYGCAGLQWLSLSVHGCIVPAWKFLSMMQFLFEFHWFMSFMSFHWSCIEFTCCQTVTPVLHIVCMLCMKCKAPHWLVVPGACYLVSSVQIFIVSACFA